MAGQVTSPGGLRGGDDERERLAPRAPPVVEIVRVEPADTHALRRRVLRGGDPEAVVDVARDHVDGVLHLGARDVATGELVGVASFLPNETAWRPGRRAYQLRWMAVDEGHRGAGVGRALLDHAVPQLREAGAAVLWANGRDTALAFYERCGMHVVGDGFVNDAGVAHHVVITDLA